MHRACLKTENEVNPSRHTSSHQAHADLLRPQLTFFPLGSHPLDWPAASREGRPVERVAAKGEECELWAEEIRTGLERGCVTRGVCFVFRFQAAASRAAAACWRLSFSGDTAVEAITALVVRWPRVLLLIFVAADDARFTMMCLVMLSFVMVKV